MGDKARLEVRIAQIAGRQLGNITRAQLIGLGMSTTPIDRWVKLGRLHRVYPGVYAVGRPPITPLEKAAAAVLACGPRAALSHGSAMTLWGFWKRWDSPLAVTVVGDRRPKGIRTYRSAGLLRRDFDVQLGIRATSPARTLLDAAPRMSAKSLARAVNDARRANLISLEALADVVERFPFHPGARMLVPHALTTQNATRSGFEDEFPEFCERFGLATPRLNTTVYGHEVDAFFEEERLIVELDGWDFHSDRESFEDDRERDATMLEHEIPTIRITKRRLRRQPAREAGRLGAILRNRRRRAA